MLVHGKEIGGAYIRRICSLGKVGTHLDPWALARIPVNNLAALERTGKIECYPAAPYQRPDDVRIHIISRGFGKFDVVEGRILNGEPLTRDQAEVLAKEDEAKNAPVQQEQ